MVISRRHCQACLSSESCQVFTFSLDCYEVCTYTSGVIPKALKMVPSATLHYNANTGFSSPEKKNITSLKKKRSAKCLIYACIHWRTVWKIGSHAKYLILLKYRYHYYYYCTVLDEGSNRKSGSIVNSIMRLLKGNYLSFEPTTCMYISYFCLHVFGHLSGVYREADQRLCFCYTESTIPLLSKSEISSL